jgi:3-deoxy-D-arabino-heptulosonate 7-phosphate (DAHP) synthase class II
VIKKMAAAAYNLPNYPAFEAREGPSLPSEWEDWIEGLDSMLDAMGIEEDKDRFVKLYHYLGPTRKILKKLDKNGIADKGFKVAKEASIF